ncbi:biotin--protein ligase [Diorhabda carinulata]|uniref:biotin--protein ligase n=1 Tax=Diorhabda carinulata TaxID=1163345 RepID=UPI0025A05D93|nr:biotin--protein ligase [Diorhabda carinulata]XP_057664832.1 biotin--protein ligase [Diorhabda carinulata]XP_057664833.1 biotin--protein ligase [Diorhabda carinulata]
MFLTLFYMYATVIQWFRLSNLKNKLNGTLNNQNALLVCDETIIYDSKKNRSFENLLFKTQDRVGCTVVPKQKINLSQWLIFPKDYRQFPIYFSKKTIKLEPPHVYVLVQAVLETYVKHSADMIQVEKYGELVAWRASDTFEAIIKSDINKLTRIVHCFSKNPLDINHELRLLKIETVDVEGFPVKIKFEKKFTKENILKYSYAPIYWKKFAETTKDLYGKIRDVKNPKITIESGKSEERKVPVNEVKPIKKDGKKSDDKNTLEVGSGDYRRHKSGEHRRDKTVEKHKTATNTKPEVTTKTKDDVKHKKNEDKHKNKEDIKLESEDQKKKEAKAKKQTEEITIKEVKEDNKKKETDIKTDHKRKETKVEQETTVTDGVVSIKEPKEKYKKEHTKKSKSGIGKLSKRSSSEKKLVKSTALCEDVDDGYSQKPKDYLAVNPKSDKNESLSNANTHINKNNSIGKNKTKPPNILIFSDSLIAKENVKVTFDNMLNKEKYVIYDLPIDSKQNVWNDSTALVVVCGDIPPNLTSHLLQYFLNGGQLLCLCSDFLYSVLNTFTTAEVREHELVRFSYGQWKQVKMMHHIFCYQASPTKKQFSKESDQSSDNSSSPVAPRTPSAVEIQNNGKDYVIQVKVLGTEETWQTPSLLLATVKGGSGRTVFSQVHLEINPDQFEDDESKFQALKESNAARLEILKDILTNHLEIDCSGSKNVEYTPGYFLGRHDLKLKLLTDCEEIQDMKMDCRKISLLFCGKDENPPNTTSNFMPVFIHTCPSNFSTVTYFESLTTDQIGRLVIYSNVMTSSQLLLDKTLTHGIAVIPRQQTSGTGRSNNQWISPEGSANFSLQLHVPTKSPLGRALPLIQHLTMVAIVSALKKRSEFDLDIGIKWPNDLYAYGNVKIGGLIVSSVITDTTAIVNIGCGVNLDNSNPTTCINDIIKKINTDERTSLKTIPYEVYFADVFNELERIYNIVQSGNIDYFFDLYYKYWLHSDSEVSVASTSGQSMKMKIVGIDEFGFLKVQSPEGDVSTIHPDGNTFDMLQGLISRKTF